MSGVDDLERRYAALAARVLELEDREAIRNLIAAYGPAADCGDTVRAGQTWSDDGQYDIDGFGVIEGPATIAALLDGPTHQDLIAGGAAHVLSPVEIVLDGDSATAVGYSCVFRWTGEGFEPFRIAANRWILSRAAGGWRVVSRVNRLLNGAAQARAILRMSR